ncbi:MAG: branched-chain amino acid transaminase [Acidobacteriota bacterium]
MVENVDGNLTVYFRGQYMPLRDANVGILTHALHYGTGVFEGIRAHWNAERDELLVMRMAEHYERWKANCGILQIDPGLTVEDLCAITVELLRRNELRTNCYIRPLAFKSAEGIGVHCEAKSDFAIVAVPFGEYLRAENGVHAGVSSWRRIDDNAIPARAKICGAYVNSVLATEEVRASGFDEAILLNESGHVAEGSTCNVFMVRKGALITPPVYDNVLEGITRASITALANRELRIPVKERSIDHSELLVCDELFLTGTAVGVAPVTRVNHHPVGAGSPGPVTRALRELYTRAALGELTAYEHWLTPVYLSHGEQQQNRSLAEATLG